MPKYAKVAALVIVALVGATVSAYALSGGGILPLLSILNIAIVAWAEYTLYELMFKNNNDNHLAL